MKQLLILSLVLLANSTSAATGEDDLIDAASMLDRMQAAVGPAASETSPLRAAGKVSWQGMPGEGTFTEVYAGLRLARSRTDFPGFGTFEMGCDGNTVWEKSPLDIKVRHGWDACEYLRRFGRAQHVAWREMYAGARYVTDEEHGGRACHRMELEPLALLAVVDCEGETTSTPPPADVWHLDAETHLASRVEARAIGLSGEMTQIVQTFSDWRPVAGGHFAFHRTVEVSGFIMIMEYESIEAGVALDEGYFDLAEDVALAVDEAIGIDSASNADGISLTILEERHLASIRVQCKLADMQKNLSVILPESMRFVTAQGGSMSGPPIVRYYSFGDDLDFEGAMQITEPIEPTERVKASSLPAGLAVVAWHVGPYDSLGETHLKIQAYMEAEELESRGAPWEEYWTDPGLERDPAKWRTKIVQPVVEAAAGGAPEVTLVRLEERPVAALRTQCAQADISRTLSVILPECMGHVASSGAQVAGPPLVRYHLIGEQIDMEACIPVVATLEGKGRVRADSLPAGLAAVIWHVGPYHSLPKTHAKLRAYLADKGLEQGDAFWEEYWTDPGMEPDSAKWRTKVVMPVAETD